MLGTSLLCFECLYDYTFLFVITLTYIVTFGNCISKFVLYCAFSIKLYNPSLQWNIDRFQNTSWSGHYCTRL